MFATATPDATERVQRMAGVRFTAPYSAFLMPTHAERPRVVSFFHACRRSADCDVSGLGPREMALGGCEIAGVAGEYSSQLSVAGETAVVCGLRGGSSQARHCDAGRD